MNTKYIGNITELECQLAFLKSGYNVLIPYGDCERYDFVADVNGKFLRIQCKTSSPTDKEESCIKFSCRSTNKENGKMKMHKYSEEEIDFFATSFKNKCYLIPVSECGCDKRLRLLPPKNNQTRNVSWASDYELEEVLKQYS